MEMCIPVFVLLGKKCLRMGRWKEIGGEQESVRVCNSWIVEDHKLVENQREIKNPYYHHPQKREREGKEFIGESF